MTMAVLQNRTQIDQARTELRRRGLSVLDSSPPTLLRKIGLDSSPAIGDEIKSWDVLKTVEFIEKHLPKDAPIADIGAFASEVLVVLHRLGYSRLTGVDLNPKLQKMAHADAIRYVVSDFLKTPFDDGSFQAITSISVIEHGFQSQRLLKEVSRLLSPGGYFIASFDYWPEKIDTTGTKFFDMDWLIFSESEVSSFVREAKAFGLQPAGDLQPQASDKPIECGGKKYTFGWLVLQKAG